AQIPQAIAAASIMLTVYYWRRQGQRRSARNLGAVGNDRKQRGYDKSHTGTSAPWLPSWARCGVLMGVLAVAAGASRRP
ncbi:MAG TPA: hypothetical protein VF874_01970, partial [Mycobacterium sp.]